MAVSGPEMPPCRTQSRAACDQAEELQSKPETRPGVFGEPWDASWLWFAHLAEEPKASNHMPRLLQVRDTRRSRKR